MKVSKSPVPLWLKIAYTVWFVIWVAAYWRDPGPQNFLWACDVANFIVLVALWRESPLLTSSQAVSILLIQVVWTLDFTTRLVFGVHLVGGTEYMFETVKPWYRRSLSLFHVWMPILLLWLIPRLGYHRAAFRFQTLVAWIVLPLAYAWTDPERNINWLFAPFGYEQVWMPGWAFVLVSMALWPVLLYLPVHGVLRMWAKRSDSVKLVP